MGTNVTFDLTRYRDRNSSHVDEGRYRVQIEYVESTEAKSGNPMLNVGMRVVDGQFKGSMFIDRLTLVENAMFRSVSLLNALGYPAKPGKKLRLDVDKWVGRQLLVDVEDGDPYKGQVKSEVRGHIALPKDMEAEDTDLDDDAEPEDEDVEDVDPDDEDYDDEVDDEDYDDDDAEDEDVSDEPTDYDEDEEPEKVTKAKAKRRAARNLAVVDDGEPEPEQDDDEVAEEPAPKPRKRRARKAPEPEPVDETEEEIPEEVDLDSIELG